MHNPYHGWSPASYNDMPLTNLNRHLEHQIRQIRQDHRLRSLAPLRQLEHGRIADAGREYLNLSGNDYLGP